MMEQQAVKVNNGLVVEVVEGLVVEVVVYN